MLPAPRPPLVDVADIIRLVGKVTFQRGQEYARSGAVLDVVWDAAASRLTATVQGSAARPYRCRIEMTAGQSGRLRPVGSTCSCPVNYDCKHVAAAIVRGNALNIERFAAESPEIVPAARVAAGRTATSSVSTSSAASSSAASGAVDGPPSWKTALGTLTGADSLARETAGAADGGAARLEQAATRMGLQFELREQTPRTRDRWRGPTARAATASASESGPGAGSMRLGVRPVILNTNGNWVRANITWNTVAHQVHRHELDQSHSRWMAQFAALHRATRDVYSGQDADWLYLDDFASPLLWNLVVEAARLGIHFTGSRKDTVVTVGERASVSLDASLVADPGAATGPDAAADLLLAATLSIDGARHPPVYAGAVGTHGVYVHDLAASETGAGASILLAPTAESLTDHQRALLGRPSDVVIPAVDIAEFLAEFYPLLRRTIPIASADSSVVFPTYLPPVLRLTARFAPKQALGLAWDWELDSGYRDAAVEGAIVDRVEAVVGSLFRFDAVEPLPAPVTIRGITAAEFSVNTLPALEALGGVRVEIRGDRPDYRELLEPPSLIITTVETDQRDWFDLGVMVTIEGRTVPFGPLFAALAKGQTKLLLVDNSYLSLDQPELARLHELIEEARSLQEWDTGLRISRYQASLWSDLEELADDTEQAVAWRASVGGLLEIESVEATPPPASLKATLRPYQLDGFQWLAFLWKHQLGGILADDMGLGKTLQALALLVHATEQAARELPAPPRRPFLVVAPTSVVGNWLSECARFAPSLTVRGIAATGAKSRMPLADLIAGADVVVTSYALFRLDFDAYQAEDWAGLILDEAQFVKNRASRVHQCAKDLNTPFRLAITGTPMENTLLELWSLFEIVAPGLFPSARRFTEEYQRPIEGSAGADGPQRAELLARLRRRIRPLMMRRAKELVASDLPAKQEQVLSIELEPRHQKVYETFLQRERQKLLGLIEDMDKNRFIVFRSLTLLRLLSLDASLVDDAYANIPSSKLNALFEQLEDVVAEGHRALIFSQFTSFLAKAAARLDAEGIEYCYLDGTTRHRQEVIARFKDGTAPVFLISLKAGGFGLNLTEADYVFLLDPWWNPATEAQAIDRTHRIGQERNVMVYRMVAANTIEEKVMALKERKARLFTSVMDDDAVFSAALTADDIRGLLDAD